MIEDAVKVAMDVVEMCESEVRGLRRTTRGPRDSGGGGGGGDGDDVWLAVGLSAAALFTIVFVVGCVWYAVKRRKSAETGKEPIEAVRLCPPPEASVASSPANRPYPPCPAGDGGPGLPYPDAEPNLLPALPASSDHPPYPLTAGHSSH